ncbi:MAG: hypothetical protein ACQCXQ_14695, partial [Verrucomicrobiales bacterium]
AVEELVTPAETAVAMAAKTAADFRRFIIMRWSFALDGIGIEMETGESKKTKFRGVWAVFQRDRPHPRTIRRIRRIPKNFFWSMGNR